MTVALEVGHSLTELNFARILHAGNRFRPKTITASSTATGSDGEEPDNGLTYEYWVPFDNSVPQPLDFGHTDYTLTNATVAADGQTFAETTATGEHSIADGGGTLSAVEWVFGVKVERQTIPEIQLKVNDGTTNFTCFFDLRDGTTGTAANATGNIVDLGFGEYYCSIRFTPLAASSTFTILAANGSEVTSYAGATASTIKLLRADLNPSEATWDFTDFAAQAGDVFCIAGHNLGSRGGRVQFEHDSNNDTTYTVIGSSSPSDDSPIMFLHDGVTSSEWRVTIDRAGGPKIAVIRIGSVLQMERPFYGGFSPVHWNRTTQLVGNKSEGGQFLGRDTISRGFAARYEWQNLSNTWIRSNLDGKAGLIQAVEMEPFFIAWRASAEQDCDYVWTAGPVGGPVFSGTRDLATFSIEAEGLGYE